MCKATFRYCLSRKDPLILIIQRYNRESRLTIVAAEVYFRHYTKSLSNYGRTCVNCTSLPLACFVYHSLYAHTRYYLLVVWLIHKYLFVVVNPPNRLTVVLSYYLISLSSPHFTFAWHSRQDQHHHQLHQHPSRHPCSFVADPGHNLT